MTSFLLFFILMLVLEVIPVLVFVDRIAARGRATGVPAANWAGFAFLVGVAAGMGTQWVIAQSLVRQMQNGQLNAFKWGAPSIVFGGIIAATVGAGSIYLYFRMRTARDPDYEELTAPPSDVADVRQPGDGDHVRPQE